MAFVVSKFRFSNCSVMSTAVIPWNWHTRTVRLSLPELTFIELVMPSSVSSLLLAQHLSQRLGLSNGVSSSHQVNACQSTMIFLVGLAPSLPQNSTTIHACSICKHHAYHPTTVEIADENWELVKPVLPWTGLARGLYCSGWNSLSSISWHRWTLPPVLWGVKSPLLARPNYSGKTILQWKRKIF